MALAALGQRQNQFSPIRSRSPAGAAAVNGAAKITSGHRRAAATAAFRLAGRPKPRLVRCYDAPAEARAVADEILTNVEAGKRLRDQAVLLPVAHDSDLHEIELNALHVRFRKYG